MIMNNIIIICWLIFLFYWFVSAFFIKKSAEKKSWWQKMGILRFFFAIVLVYYIIKKKPASFALSSTFGPEIFRSTLTLHIFGLILTVAGLLGALWARTIIGRNWSGYATYKENHELVTNGPYRFVRHPIYSSIFLMFLGTFLYSGLGFVIVMFIIILFVFLARIKKEEKIMVELFGKKYEDYIKNTYALIPGVY